METKLIELRGVSKAYDVAAGKFLALKNVDMKVGAGEFVAVVGKSGSGKSTLINMITGIDSPTSGEIPPPPPPPTPTPKSPLFPPHHYLGKPPSAFLKFSFPPPRSGGMNRPPP